MTNFYLGTMEPSSLKELAEGTLSSLPTSYFSDTLSVEIPSLNFPSFNDVTFVKISYKENISSLIKLLQKTNNSIYID